MSFGITKLDCKVLFQKREQHQMERHIGLNIGKFPFWEGYVVVCLGELRMHEVCAHVSV